MNCNQCDKPFNAHLRVPKLLPNCGHSICNECLNKLTSTTFSTFRCPFDNIQYPKDQTYNNNLYVMSMLEPQTETEPLKPAQCRRHNRSLDIFCNRCKEEICADCVLFGEHRSHDYEQLNAAKAKNETRLKDYMSQFAGLKDNIAWKKVKQSLLEVKEEKTEIVNQAFDDLLKEIEILRKSTLSSVSSIYDSYSHSVDNLGIRLDELLGNMDKAVNMGDHTYILRKEESLKKELQQIEKFTGNDIFKGKDGVEKKINIQFDSKLKESICNFCVISKRGENVEPVRKQSSGNKIQPDDDLLQQSFTDLMQNADSLINLDNNEQGRHKATTNTNQNKNLLDRGSHSPVSYFSNCSAMKGVSRKEEKGMLSKHKYSTHSLMSNNSINPVYTTKKPRTPLNYSPNLSNVSKVTKNSTSPSPFKIDIPNSKPNENITGEKENCQRLANTQGGDQMLQKVRKAIERVEKAGLLVLDLSKCEIDDKTMEELSKSILKLSKVKTINLDGNNLTELGLKCLLKNIKDNVVEYLFVNQNKLKDSALDYLISFKKYNTKLKAVYMSNNPINQTSHKVKAKASMLDNSNIVVVL